MSIGWHGCLFLACVGAVSTVAAPPGEPPSRVPTPRFDIAYEVNADSLPLTRVDLWYSIDRGESWRHFGNDPDLQSPMPFEAASEGLYGFFMVIENEVGASTTPPISGVEPQQWAFVDYSPPILQAAPASLERTGIERIVRVRWSAVDAHFDQRPIELAYRTAPDGEWRGLDERLANTGMYDWRPSRDLDGSVWLRVTATDRGGNRAEVIGQPIDLDHRPAPAAEVPALAMAPAMALAVAVPAASAQLSADDAALARSDKLLQRGIAHKGQGEYRLAVSRFRDALVLHPRLTEALVQLGETLYFQRQYPESIRAYRLALEQESSWSQPRRGLARSLVEARQYEEAAAEIARLLEADPKDAEAWLDRGDVAMRRGDEAAARESWRAAESLAPGADEIVERARARLFDVERIARLRPKAGVP